MGWLTRKHFMTNETVELYFQDRILAKIFIPIIPHWIKPNHITILRFILIPFNLYFLVQENWQFLLYLFIFTALTDLVDGALARVRKQITFLGSVLDPLADKIFILSVGGLFILQEVHYILVFTMALLEFLIILGGYVRERRGEYVSANGSGKIKMFLQVLGFSFLLLSKVVGISLFYWIGLVIIVASLPFAVISLITYGL